MDKMMPTCHSDDKPISCQWTGRTIYSMESPMRQAAVMREMLIIGRWEDIGIVVHSSVR
jgi:gamma-glutamyltranspeptidase